MKGVLNSIPKSTNQCLQEKDDIDFICNYEHMTDILDALFYKEVTLDGCRKCEGKFEIYIKGDCSCLRIVFSERPKYSDFVGNMQKSH